MSSRRVHQAPTFVAVQDHSEIHKLILEIKKFKPSVEVSIENQPHLATGRIVDWNAEKKLFTVEWENLSEGFKEGAALKTGLRAFFKATLFSVPLLFKCELIRRLPDGTYHYRTPEVMYKNQKRTSLRVPLPPGAGVLETPVGNFAVLDLSVAGAKLAMPLLKSKGIHRIESTSLKLGGRRFRAPDFGIAITSRSDAFVGCRFHGLNEGLQVEIKQFLMEILHDHFKKGK